MIPTLIIAALILMNALFVTAEFAIISVPKATAERRAAQGSRSAALVLSVLQNPRLQDRYIATAQLGITLASLGLGMYGEHVLARALAELLTGVSWASPSTIHGLATVAAIALLTYLHIVLGEMIPKTLALGHAEATAFWLSTPMVWAQRALLPMVVAFNALGVGLLRLLGVRRELAVNSATTDDLRFIVEESVAQGKLSAQAGEVLTELFEFGQRTAAEVMTPRVRVVGIPRAVTPEGLQKLLRRSRHTRYPVYEETLDRIVGVVLVRDLLAALVHGEGLSPRVVRPVPFVPESARLDDVLALMSRARTQAVIVMDEHGGTAGLVTIEDMFQEIVGEIPGSQDRTAPVHRKDGKLRALGVARLEELGEALELELQHEEVDTVSGLVLALLNRPPSVGDLVAWKGVGFRVLSVEGHGVDECEVELRPSVPPIEPTGL
ncbi:MAG TPA: hemolysin family protein [Polyangiaceae bacterium]|nr:hemolysin family protein [Polyangiaceae bacterium]